MVCRMEEFYSPELFPFWKSMRILIVRRTVEKRNNIPNGLSSARGAENRYTNAKEEGVWGGWQGRKWNSFTLVGKETEKAVEELGWSFLDNMLSKHSPPQFCHVEEIRFNNPQISPMAFLWTKNKMQTPCPGWQGLIWSGLWLSLQPDPIVLAHFTSVQSSKPQFLHLAKLLQVSGVLGPFVPLPGMFVSKTFGLLSSSQLSGLNSQVTYLKKISTYLSILKYPLLLTLPIQYTAFFSSEYLSIPEKKMVHYIEYRVLSTPWNTNC